LCVCAHGADPSLSQPFLIKEQGKLRFCRNAASNLVGSALFFTLTQAIKKGGEKPVLTKFQVAKSRLIGSVSFFFLKKKLLYMMIW
jgi:hypothetical protein